MNEEKVRNEKRKTTPRLFKSYGFNKSINLSKSNPAEGGSTTVDTVALIILCLFNLSTEDLIDFLTRVSKSPHLKRCGREECSTSTNEQLIGLIRRC